MDASSIDISLLISAMMIAATPILLAALGELVVEKTGVLNLGVEGMMIIGAISGFAMAVQTGSPLAGFVGAAAAGAVLSLLFAFLTQIALANQVASGLALTLFGLGLSSLIGTDYDGLIPPATAPLHIPLLADIPGLGPMLFQHDPMVYLTLLWGKTMMRPMRWGIRWCGFAFWRSCSAEPVPGWVALICRWCGCRSGPRA